MGFSWAPLQQLLGGGTWTVFSCKFFSRDKLKRGSCPPIEACPPADITRRRLPLARPARRLGLRLLARREERGPRAESHHISHPRTAGQSGGWRTGFSAHGVASADVRSREKESIVPRVDGCGRSAQKLEVRRQAGRLTGRGSLGSKGRIEYRLHGKAEKLIAPLVGKVQSQNIHKVNTAQSGWLEPQCCQHYPHGAVQRTVPGGCVLLSTHSALSCSSFIIDCCSPMTREQSQESGWWRKRDTQ